jgi:hypothetical protein
MNHIRRFLPVLFALALATLVACGQPQSTATPTTAAATAAPTVAKAGANAAPTRAPTAVPTTAARAATTAPTTTTDDDTVGDVDDIELNDRIKTYREVNSMVSTVEETVEYEWHTLLEVNRDQPASRTVMTGTEASGSSSDFEIIAIGPDSYTRFGTEWMTVTGQDDPLNAVRGVTAWMNPKNWRDNENCKYKGRENVNGEATRHWFCDEKALAGIGASVVGAGLYKEGGLDTWISTEYNVTVRSALEWRGTNDAGKATLLKIDHDIFDMNKPITIEPPEGVSKTGLPDDIPLIEGATEVVSISGMVNFQVAKTVTEVTEYYTEAMDDNGWKTGDTSGIPGMLSFTKDKRTAQFMINEDGGTTAVIIIVQES